MLLLPGHAGPLPTPSSPSVASRRGCDHCGSLCSFPTTDCSCRVGRIVAQWYRARSPLYSSAMQMLAGYAEGPCLLNSGSRAENVDPAACHHQHAVLWLLRGTIKSLRMQSLAKGTCERALSHCMTPSSADGADGAKTLLRRYLLRVHGSKTVRDESWGGSATRSLPLKCEQAPDVAMPRMQYFPTPQRDWPRCTATPWP